MDVSNRKNKTKYKYHRKGTGLAYHCIFIVRYCFLLAIKMYEKAIVS